MNQSIEINSELIDRTKVLAFDLDDTLAESKAAISKDMASTISVLLKSFYICIISGGAFSQMQSQVIQYLPQENMGRLIFFPENGSSLYMWDESSGNFQAKYRELLSDEEKVLIISAFKRAEAELPELIGLQAVGQVYGDRVEDRGGQITFSALGQLAPVEAKRFWDPDRSKRLVVKEFLDKILPQSLEVRIGGATSLDVIHKGKDKAYAIGKLFHLSKYGIEDFKLEEIIFFGDSLNEGGNDYPVKSTGVMTIAVTQPGDTLKHLRGIAKV